MANQPILIFAGVVASDLAANRRFQFWRDLARILNPLTKIYDCRSVILLDFLRQLELQLASVKSCSEVLGGQAQAVVGQVLQQYVAVGIVFFILQANFGR